MIERSLRWVGLAAASLALAGGGLMGCTVENASVMGRDGDPALYAAEVQPIVSARCAFEGCHGREGMPLTLYAVNFLRLRDPLGDIDPDLPALDERALSEAELEHNRRSLAVRASASDPQGDEVMLRLISIAEGGIPHGDTVVYPSTADPELEVLRRFLGGTHDAW